MEEQSDSLFHTHYYTLAGAGLPDLQAVFEYAEELAEISEHDKNMKYLV